MATTGGFGFLGFFFLLDSFGTAVFGRGKESFKKTSKGRLCPFKASAVTSGTQGGQGQAGQARIGGHLLIEGSSIRPPPPPEVQWGDTGT